MRLEAKRMAQDSLFNLEKKINKTVEMKNKLEFEERQALERYIDLLKTHKQSLETFLDD